MKFYFSLFLFCVSIAIGAQNLTAKVVDAQQNAIPFATIQTGINQGVITNEEGYFTVNLDDLNADELTISCMGFASKIVSIKTIERNNYIIVLEEFVNELKQVNLTGETPDADAIIAKVNQRLEANYKNENRRYNLFFRNTSYVDFGDLEFKITKASGFRKKQLTGVNSSLDSLSNTIKNNKTVYFKDYLADFLLLNKENSKLDVVKATRLIDQSKNVSVDQIQETAQNVFLKYLDTTKTYKVKTGIIKVDDSLSISQSNQAQQANPTYEYDVENLRNETHELLHKSQIYSNSTLRKIVNPELYKYTFQDITFYNDEMIYIINFKPRKAKAKYTGTLFIADDTYAVIKTDYAYAKGKRGDKLNLKLILGIKFIENVKRGTIIFKKNAEGTYEPQYIKEESGSYFYVNRPIKFIENSPEKNKVGFNFLIEGNKRDKHELLIVSEDPMEAASFNAFNEKEKVPYQNLKRYDPTIWKSYNALEPLEEMKVFKAEDN